jgi:hypothetical protein
MVVFNAIFIWPSTQIWIMNCHRDEKKNHFWFVKDVQSSVGKKVEPHLFFSLLIIEEHSIFCLTGKKKTLNLVNLLCPKTLTGTYILKATFWFVTIMEFRTFLEFPLQHIFLVYFIIDTYLEQWWAVNFLIIDYSRTFNLLHWKKSEF